MSGKVVVSCSRCARQFTRWRAHASRVKVHFCSRACYHGPTPVRARRRLQDYTTGALTAALRAKGYSVRLVRLA